MGHIDSKFGISIHQVPHILRVVENTAMNINGIHMHTGSDILDIDTFVRATKILFDVAKQFENIDFIDFGSGFKVPYKEGDISTDIEQLGVQLSKRFNEFCEEYEKKISNYPVVNAENIIKMHLIIWLLIDFSQKMACFIE